MYAADPKTFNESGVLLLSLMMVLFCCCTDEDIYRLLQSECCRHTVNRIRTTSIRPVSKQQPMAGSISMCFY